MKKHRENERERNRVLFLMSNASFIRTVKWRVGGWGGVVLQGGGGGGL